MAAAIQATTASERVIRQELTRRFRALLSGSQTGVPDWTPLVAAGDDARRLGPHDEPWIVHSDLATLIGGIRALLVQALHPGSLAGVVQHSRYEEDVLGRLNGTIRWLTIATFGSTTAVEAESARVRALHERVRGNYQTSSGEDRSYRASDNDLLTWVHIAFTDSFLAAHRLYGRRAVDADRYIAQWAGAVEPLGLSRAPGSEADLRSAMASFEDELRVDASTKKVIAFIKRVPFPRGAMPVYWLLFHAAVDSLPAEYRAMLGLRTVPSWVIRPIARALIRVMRWIVGPRSPMENVALERRLRAGARD